MCKWRFKNLNPVLKILCLSHRSAYVQRYGSPFYFGEYCTWISSTKSQKTLFAGFERYQTGPRQNDVAGQNCLIAINPIFSYNDPKKMKDGNRIYTTQFRRNHTSAVETNKEQERDHTGSSVLQ